MFLTVPDHMLYQSSAAPSDTEQLSSSGVSTDHRSDVYSARRDSFLNIPNTEQTNPTKKTDSSLDVNDSEESSFNPLASRAEGPEEDQTDITSVDSAIVYSGSENVGLKTTSPIVTTTADNTSPSDTMNTSLNTMNSNKSNLPSEKTSRDKKPKHPTTLPKLTPVPRLGCTVEHHSEENLFKDSAYHSKDQSLEKCLSLCNSNSVSPTVSYSNTQRDKEQANIYKNSPNR